MLPIDFFVGLTDGMPRFGFYDRLWLPSLLKRREVPMPESLHEGFWWKGGMRKEEMECFKDIHGRGCVGQSTGGGSEMWPLR